MAKKSIQKDFFAKENETNVMLIKIIKSRTELTENTENFSVGFASSMRYSSYQAVSSPTEKLIVNSEKTLTTDYSQLL